MPCQKRQQLIQALIARQPAFPLMQRKKRLVDRGRQHRIVGQRAVEGAFQHRSVPQSAAAHRVGDPALRQIKHRIGKPLGLRRMAIVHRARLDQHGAPRPAGMQRAVAMETLQALLRDAHQHFIMIVRIVGMPLKVSVDALNTGFVIASQFEPVFMLMI